MSNGVLLYSLSPNLGLEGLVYLYIAHIGVIGAFISSLVIFKICEKKLHLAKIPLLIKLPTIFFIVSAALLFFWATAILSSRQQEMANSEFKVHPTVISETLTQAPLPPSGSAGIPPGEGEALLPRYYYTLILELDNQSNKEYRDLNLTARVQSKKELSEKYDFGPQYTLASPYDEIRLLPRGKTVVTLKTEIQPHGELIDPLDPRIQNEINTDNEVKLSISDRLDGIRANYTLESKIHTWYETYTSLRTPTNQPKESTIRSGWIVYENPGYRFGIERPKDWKLNYSFPIGFPSPTEPIDNEEISSIHLEKFPNIIVFNWSSQPWTNPCAQGTTQVSREEAEQIIKTRLSPEKFIAWRSAVNAIYSNGITIGICYGDQDKENNKQEVIDVISTLYQL